MKTQYRSRPIPARASPSPCPLALALALFAAMPRPAPAATVTLQQGARGYTGTTDAWLDESQKRDNYGADPTLRVQYNNGASDHTLVKFVLPSLSFQSLPSATLGLYYYDQSSMSADNALFITPYRISASTWWDENVGNGLAHQGVSWTYRDIGETLAWSGLYGVWDSKLDDGNSTAKIKRIGGSVPDAIAPPAWVTWNVQNSISQWHAGQANNGFVLYESGFQGSGFILAGLFYSRHNGLSSYCPYLTITYQGAQIAWSGNASGTWDTATANWNVGGYPGTFGAGDYVTFADGAANPAITVTGGGVAPGSVTINNAATIYSFSGGSFGGAATLTKLGSGTATLLAANSFSGITQVRAGKLMVAANNALGSTGGGTVVSNGAALGLQAVSYSTAEPLTLSGTGVSSSGVLYTVSGTSIFAGPITLADDSTVGVVAPGALTLSGAITGNHGLTKEGTGSLTLGGGSANAYTGVTIVSRGALLLNKSGGPAVPGVLTIGDGTNPSSVQCQAPLQIAATATATVRENSLLDLGGYDAELTALMLSGGSVQSGAGTLWINGPVTSTGTQAATISGRLRLLGTPTVSVMNSGDLILAATVFGDGFNKRGPGRLLLTNTNTFTAVSQVLEGSVLINNDPSLGWGAGPGGVTVATGSLLGGTGSICGPTTVSNAGTLAPGASLGTLIISGPLTLGIGSRLAVEVGQQGPMPIIDQLDLNNAGGLVLEPGARLQLMGILTGSNAYVFVKHATNVTGTFIGLPQHGPLPPPNQAWRIHYTTHSVYLGQNPTTLWYFRALATNHAVIVTWRTAVEIETKGFDLFRWDDAWEWVKVNPKMIPAQNPFGAVYLLADPGLRPGVTVRYRLVEYSANGNETYEFERTPTEFAFSAPPSFATAKVELRWWSRTDETYELWHSPDLSTPGLSLLTNGIPADPPENVLLWPATATNGYYRLRLTP